MLDMQDSQRRRLGRGLSALLGGGAPAAEEKFSNETSELRQISVDLIDRNPYQPRKSFDAEGIEDLSASIREHGLLQPLLVREFGERFQLVAGERRLLAARKAGLGTIPCRVIDVVDKTACEFALEENLKRKDLNDIEKAIAFRDYLQHFHCTIEELARQLSMSRSAVSNTLRLLDLPEIVQNALMAGRISSGHARALLSLEPADQLALCGRIQAETLNVRQTEAAVKQLLGKHATPAAVENPVVTEGESASADLGQSPTAETPDLQTGTAVAGEATGQGSGNSQETVPFEAPERTPHVRSLEEQLRHLLGAPVEIRLTGKESGSIVIPFHSNDEFERILRELRRRDAA